MAPYQMSFYDSREALKAAVEAIESTVPVSRCACQEFGRVTYVLLVGTAPA
ncbi:MAG: hypothetical protein PWP08_899 [Methanofollis sp.]|nr:hypothetical protein [Methanofollis sp.]